MEKGSFINCAPVEDSWRTRMEYKEHILRQVIRHIFLSRRQRKGLTQNNLSEISNITRQFISQVESGKRQPSVFTLSNLAYAYGLTLSQLFQEIDTLYEKFDSRESSEPSKENPGHP